MFNVKVGDTVFHKGKKRKVTYAREFAGARLLHLTGLPYMVFYGSVKPVFRVTEIRRARLIILRCFEICEKIKSASVMEWDSFSGSDDLPFSFSEYKNAILTLQGVLGFCSEWEGTRIVKTFRRVEG